MQAATLLTTGQIVSTLIGNDIMTKAISDSASTIYGLLYGFTDITDVELKSLMDNLDIREQVRTVESILQTMLPQINNKSKNAHHAGDTYSQLPSHPISISLEGLHEIICKIREDLKQIQHNIDEHKKTYMYYITKPNHRTQIHNLKLHKKILQERLDMFMKVLQVEQLLQRKPTFHAYPLPPIQENIRLCRKNKEMIADKKRKLC